MPVENILIRTRARTLLICATALGFTGLGYAKGSPKGPPSSVPSSPGKRKGKSQPVVAVPEPPAKAESLIYLTGILGAAWFLRRKQKVKQSRNAYS